MNSEAGQLLQRALSIRLALKIGLQVTLDDIQTEELHAIVAINELQDEYEQEKAKEER
jgi:hypothetical protein